MTILYSVNCFDFNHFEAALLFFSAVGPQNLQSIRSIRLAWDYFPTDFLSVTISGLKRLHYLYLIIEAHCPPYSAERAKRLLAPLKSLTGIKDFQVHFLWWMREDISQFLEDAPFVLHASPRASYEWDNSGR